MGRPNACCNEPANLDRHVDGPGRSFEKCRVCGCRHFEMDAQPGLIIQRGGRIG